MSVGRIKADPTAPLVDDYTGRIAKFIPFEEVVLKANDAQAEEKMHKAADRAAITVAMDERGHQHDSFAFADLMASWMNAGQGRVLILIGGDDGLHPGIRQRADLSLGLSRMTLPHRLARLILVEQMYRALCIIRNVPYQK